MNWPMQPRKRQSDEHGQEVLSRLSVEIDQLSQEWSAYRGGRLDRGKSIAAAAGEPPVPLDPEQEAADYLFGGWEDHTSPPPPRVGQ